MPLSEREQQLLEQMERALYEEDPRFASQLRSGAEGYARRRHYLVSGAIVVLGLAVVVAAVMLESVPLGVVGFIVMVAGGSYAASPRRVPLGTVQPDGSVRPAHTGATRLRAQQAKHPRPTRSGTFMERLEQRWEERRSRGEW